MLSEPSVQRISVSSEMEEWWQTEISKRQPTSTSTGEASRSAHGDKLDSTRSGRKDVTERGDSVKEEAQWGHTLPGHGGT